MKKQFLWLLGVMFLFLGCGEEKTKIYNITIKGVVSPIIGATVKAYSTDDNSFLGETVCDQSGNYIIQIDKSRVFEGYRLRAFGGTIGENQFTEDLSAIYFKSDNLFENSNITPITTLIHRYSDVFEENPYIDRKISLSLQKLVSIGMIKKVDFNGLDSDFVEEDKITEEIANGSGVENWLKNIKNELNQQSYYGTAKYFPNINGGISEVTIDRAENITQVFKGRVFEADVEIFKYNRDDEREILFEIVSAPEGMTISEEGKIVFSVSEESETQIHNYSIRVTDMVTGIKHTLNGKIDVMDTNVILSGVIGSEGGVLSDYYGDYVLTVPENAVDEPTEFKIFRAINEETGFYSYVVDAQGKELIVDFKYPQELKPEISRTRKLTKANKSSSMSEIKTYNANFVLNMRIRSNGYSMSGFKTDTKDSAKLYKYPSSHSDLKPILLVHGYQPNNKMADDDYWADTAKLLSEKGYTVYEFRWRTNARFSDVADDLAEAIKYIAENTGKKVTIIAHSFGGLLSRTYLQGYSTTMTYNNDVQSLITIGTPHSGIFDNSKNISFNGGSSINFPKGQDSFAHELCGQISCHEAGENVVSQNLILEVFSNEKLKEYFGIERNSGELVYKLSQMTTGHQMPVDTLVLIGLKWKLDQQIFAEDIFRYENGDGLISYNGQRFLPSFRTSARVQNGYTLAGGKKVYEKVLGGVWESKPNSTVGTWSQALRGEISQYEHSEATLGDGLPEVAITNENKSFHHTYLEILSWLTKNPANSYHYEENSLLIKFELIDGSTNQIITDFSSRNISVNKQYSININQNKVSIGLAFSFTTYEIVINIAGYHRQALRTTTTTTSGYPENGILNFGEIRLQREVVEGLLPGEDICDGINCGAGECVTENSMAKCSCPEGTFEDGLSCKVNNCIGISCIQNATCNPTNRGCVCNKGFAFNPSQTTCIQTQTNLCANIICPERANCNSSTGGCECDPGYLLINGQCIFDASNQNCGADNMCLIPAGTFTMGCAVGDSNCGSNESPRHSVTLSAYKMDRYEVTVAQFRACVNAGVCTSENFKVYHKNTDQYCNIFRIGNSYDNHPMNCVNWNGAKQYCEWKGKRLPTEAEWEYAARGSNSTKYPWGNQKPTSKYAVYGSSIGTAVVGSKPLGKSPFGLYDMGGNVWEWTNDWYVVYDDNNGIPVKNPQQLGGSTFKVLRGGGWGNSNNYSLTLCSSCRFRFNPSSLGSSIGFRCVQSQ
ncbi:alpha/beta fold hydrolase [bacterium]|nr:alpha/beta fold hydrolase [bacterium]